MQIERKTCLVLTLRTFLAFSISMGSGWFAPKTFSTCSFKQIWKTSDHQLIGGNGKKKLNNFPYTSLIKESVWSISISLIAFLPMPFCCGGKSFLDWPFAAPLPLPAPETAPPRAVDFFIPRPGPGPGRPPLREMPGSSPSHRISSGDIYH